MATNKIFLILLGLFLIAAGFLGSAKGVGAETLNLRVTNVVTKIEIFPVGNVEGYGIGYALGMVSSPQKMGNL